MEKIKVSKEVAAFLERAKSNGEFYWEDALLEQIAILKNAPIETSEIKDEAKCMLQYSTFEVAQMLVNGWEVEKTFNELKDYVQELKEVCRETALSLINIRSSLENAEGWHKDLSLQYEKDSLQAAIDTLRRESRAL